MITKSFICKHCDVALFRVKTNFSLYFKEGDIYIKNYPIYVCPSCANILILKQDRKKTVNFLNYHKKKFF